MIKHQLTLDYSLAAGWMGPFIDGLQTGKAVARQCSNCNRASFPPLRTCPCGVADGIWVTLQGTARITSRTDGSDGSFGLVRFEGADTSAVVSLQGIDMDQIHGTLAEPDGPLPMMILKSLPDVTSHE